MSHSTFFVKSYGCQMNIYDSEKITSILENKGLKLNKYAEDADLIVFNTQTGKRVLHKQQDPFCCSSLTFSVDEKSIFATGTDARIRSWSITSGKLLQSKRFSWEKSPMIQNIVMSPDQHRLYFYGQIWKLKDNLIREEVVISK